MGSLWLTAVVLAPVRREFATKPALARVMIARALEAGIPVRWMAADKVYGADPGLRADRHPREVGYVLDDLFQGVSQWS